MPSETTTRRKFLLAAITTSTAMSCGFNLSVIRSGVAWAEASPDMSPESIKSLMLMARSLFPHAGLADNVYAEIVDGMLSASADDPALDSVLGQAVSALDAASDKDFFELTEQSQLQVMNSLSESEFFEAIVNQVRLRLYSHSKLWAVIGYPGSSVEYGGYLERGFNDIDWLPEDA
jgi:hypothetical protein